jgi:hypothetical protein
MRLSDIFSARFLKWFVIGVAIAAASDFALGLIFTAAESALLPPTLGIVKVVLLVVLTVLALLLIGERTWQAIAASSVATVAGFFIGAVHLAALSIGVSVITLGERIERIERGGTAVATVRRASRAARRTRRSRR